MVKDLKVIHFLFLTLIILTFFITPLFAGSEGEMKHKDKKNMQQMEKIDKSSSAEHWIAPKEAVKRINPILADKESIERGKNFYQTNCAICHGKSAQGDGPGGSGLTPKPANLTAMAGQHPDGNFAWKIATGRGAMPAWKSILTENQIWDIVNFIQSLATADKKEKGMPMHDKKDMP